MSNVLTSEVISADAAVDRMERRAGANGLRYAVLGEGIGTGVSAAAHTSDEELRRLVETVPSAVAGALAATTYAFVPLALSAARLRGEDAVVDGNDATLIAPRATPELTDRAICHRNAEVAGADIVFLSALLHRDSFALAFEFFINIAHDLVDTAGVPASFAELLTEQTSAGVRGETSIDAWEHRIAAFGPPPGAAEAVPSRGRGTAARPAPAASDTESRKRDYRNTAFADSVAVYLLAVFLDFDYADLREREYPLLSPPALAARLRAVHTLYPPNPGYTFQVLYRRRG